MSSGPKNVTSTTKTEIPYWLQQPLQNATDAAGRRFSQQRSLPGFQDLNENATSLVNRTLQGDFLSPESNPYLAQTFNRAADLTRTRLDSEFAGAGRNLGAALPARSDELQTLAANIFGPAYAQERGIQANTVGQAQALDPINQYIDRLAAIIPNAGGTTKATQPVYRTGLF